MDHFATFWEKQFHCHLDNPMVETIKFIFIILLKNCNETLKFGGTLHTRGLKWVLLWVYANGIEGFLPEYPNFKKIRHLVV